MRRRACLSGCLSGCLNLHVLLMLSPLATMAVHAQPQGGEADGPARGRSARPRDRPAHPGRQHRRRRWQGRRGAGPAPAGRRLHPDPRRHRPERDRACLACTTGLRLAPGPDRAGTAACRRQRAAGASRLAAAPARGPDRRGAPSARPDPVRLHPGLVRPHGDGAAAPRGGPLPDDPARMQRAAAGRPALPGRRTAAAGSGRRPGRPAVRQSRQRAGRSARRPGARAGGQQRTAPPAAARSADAGRERPARLRGAELVRPDGGARHAGAGGRAAGGSAAPGDGLGRDAACDAGRWPDPAAGRRRSHAQLLAREITRWQRLVHDGGIMLD